jgi:hypothetical protein
MKSPWVTMLFSPRATIRHIIDTGRGGEVSLLVVLSGVVFGLARMADRSAGEKEDLSTIIIFSAILGPILNSLMFVIGSALLRGTGSWLGGRASTPEIRAAMAWSTVPVIYGLPLWVVMIALMGRELFMKAYPSTESNAMLAITLTVLMVLFLGLEVWMVVLFLASLSEVQGFSVWKALANTMLVLLAVLIPLAGLFFLMVKGLGGP